MALIRSLSVCSKDSLICKTDDTPDDRLKADNQTNGISNDQIDDNYFYIFHMEIGEKDQDKTSMSEAPVANEETTLSNLHNSDDQKDVYYIIYMKMITGVITVDGNIDSKTVNDFGCEPFAKNQYNYMKMAAGFDSFIDSLRSFDSEAFKIRGPRKSPLKGSLMCKTDDTSSDQLNEARITYMKAGNQTDDISDDQMDEIYFYFSHMETGEKDHDEISMSAAPVVNEEDHVDEPAHLQDRRHLRRQDGHEPHHLHEDWRARLR